MVNALTRERNCRDGKLNTGPLVAGFQCSVAAYWISLQLSRRAISFCTRLLVAVSNRSREGEAYAEALGGLMLEIKTCVSSAISGCFSDRSASKTVSATENLTFCADISTTQTASRLPGRVTLSRHQRGIRWHPLSDLGVPEYLSSRI